MSDPVVKGDMDTMKLEHPTYEYLNVSQEVDKQNAKHMNTKQQDFNLQHPFTMMASGPTSCGKTTFVKNILMQKKIEPWPQRIVWLYKHWQPAYDIIKSALNVEFIHDLSI